MSGTAGGALGAKADGPGRPRPVTRRRDRPNSTAMCPTGSIAHTESPSGTDE